MQLKHINFFDKIYNVFLQKTIMKIAMISPNKESEKALAIISSYIVKKVRENGVKIDLITYTAGSPKSFLKILPKLKKYDIIHLQHEYNLLGFYGLPFFFILPLIWS